MWLFSVCRCLSPSDNSYTLFQASAAVLRTQFGRIRKGMPRSVREIGGSADDVQGLAQGNPLGLFRLRPESGSGVGAEKRPRDPCTGSSWGSGGSRAAGTSYRPAPPGLRRCAPTSVPPFGFSRGCAAVTPRSSEIRKNFIFRNFRAQTIPSSGYSDIRHHRTSFLYYALIAGTHTSASSFPTFPRQQPCRPILTIRMRAYPC